MGHGKNCRCKSGERSKGPKRPRKKRDSRCESAFTCDDDKLRPPSAELSIAGACCSSSGGSQIKSRRGNSGGCGKEERATHSPTTPSPGHCRFPESNQAKKKKNVAESCCGNCCDTRESDEAACCSNGPAIKCGRNADACAGTASTGCAEPCKKEKKRKYKKIWKNFKSVWSRRTRREIAIERSFRKVVRDQSVNTCSSNASLDYRYSFTECKMLTGILKHEKVAPDKSFSDIGCCTSSGVLPNYDTKSQESIRSSRSTGLDENVATSKPVQEKTKKSPPAAEPQEAKPSGGLFKKFAGKSSKDKNSDKDSKTARSTSSSKVAADKSPKKEQNTKVTIKETPSQSKSSHAKNPSQAVNKGVGTNDVEREKSKQNISVKEVSDGCQPKGHAMECKDFLVCQCSKGAKSKIKHSSCGQDSCS
ncbi:uncharacterized protein LOC100680437 [Nasonia vitripennis]|uniref:Uncharacterized protein n=1 Tax=Nasonia vitripennis TaxID=7425 RepID=A0A7M7H4B7_NASVI|nr:uncharacterized protein LOC100680437 [Nasonia vitripennis]